MHEHERVVCSCGALIMQCRCMEGGKNVRIVPNGCDDCKRRPVTPSFTAPAPDFAATLAAETIANWPAERPSVAHLVEGAIRAALKRAVEVAQESLAPEDVIEAIRALGAAS